MSLFIYKQPNTSSLTIFYPPPPSNMSNLSAIGLGSGQLPPPPTLGGGGWNAIRFQILDPLKISDITPPKKQISDISHSQKSDIWLKKSDIRPQKKKISDIKVPPFHPPPPPHSVTPCDEASQPRYVASRYRYIITPCDFQMLAGLLIQVCGIKYTCKPLKLLRYYFHNDCTYTIYQVVLYLMRNKYMKYM